jgi:hypothetical protein
MKNVLWVLMIVSLATMAFIGCDMGLLDEPTGSLTIQLNENVNARTLEPDVDMEVATYKISGTHVRSGETFGPIEIAGSITSETVENIVVGNWEITVQAYNDDATPVLIGEGSTTVTVNADETATASISVEPLSGTGSFTFTIDITNVRDLMDYPTVDVSFVPEGETTPEYITSTTGYWNAERDLATIQVDDLEAGYYDFSFVIHDGDTTYTGNHHVVRILSGETTSGSYVLPAGIPGDVEISLVNNLNNPFTVAITSDEGFVMAKDTSRTFTVAPADSASIEWFLDGVKDTGATGATFDVDSTTLTYGSHNLAAKVKKSDGTVASGTVEVVVLDGGYIAFTLSNTDPEKTDDVIHFRLESGPAADGGFDAYGTFLRYEEPTHIIFDMGGGPTSMIMGSSIPVDDAGEGNFAPASGETVPFKFLWFSVAGALDETATATPYTDNFDFQLTDLEDIDEDPVVYVASRYAGDGIGAMEITFKEFGPLEGGYVRGTLEGAVLEQGEDVPVDPEDPDAGWVSTYGDTFALKGEFVVLRAAAAAPPAE